MLQVLPLDKGIYCHIYIPTSSSNFLKHFNSHIFAVLWKYDHCQGGFHNNQSTRYPSAIKKKLTLCTLIWMSIMVQSCSPDCIQGPYQHSTLSQENQILYINQLQWAPRTGPACALDKAEKLIKTWHVIKQHYCHAFSQAVWTGSV